MLGAGSTKVVGCRAWDLEHHTLLDLVAELVEPLFHACTGDASHLVIILHVPNHFGNGAGLTSTDSLNLGSDDSSKHLCLDPFVRV